MDNFLELYNPNNAQQLTPEQLADMQLLTDDQIKQLADKYPNTGNGTAYLRLKDTSRVKDQLYPPSTWRNLYNLRVLNKRPEFIPYTFAVLFMKRRGTGNNIPVSAKVQDLTQMEIEAAPGLKKTNVGWAIASKETIDIENWEKAAASINKDEEFPDLTAEVPKRKKRTLKSKPKAK